MVATGVLAALGVTVLVWVAQVGDLRKATAPSHVGDGATATTEPRTTTTTRASVPGVAVVLVGAQRWRFHVTCNLADGRVTAQGGDGRGASLVATFDRASKQGSVTVAGAKGAWSIGPAGGTTISGVEVTATHLGGRGRFTRRAYGVPAKRDRARPVSKPTHPTAGRYSVTCERSA